jgi:multidrug efflux system membrane fusion protein
LFKLRQRAAGVTRDVVPNLTGLGTVRAFDAITVKNRLDGELQKLAFTEGQEVKA